MYSHVINRVDMVVRAFVVCVKVWVRVGEGG